MVTAEGDLPAELGKLQQAYELLGELSRDELVTVYVARDRRSGKEVAIKVLRAAGAHGREPLAHFASDARMLTALDHPNIIAVHGVKWLSEDVVAVITERVRGPSLRQVLDVAGTLPVARATEVLRGLGRALAWAHSSQIMHRDLRPENVIFEDRSGRVVLSDFGLARRIEVAPAAGETTDPYRAPELADGRYPDRRSDVFSLGIVGWELLTGRRPWPDDMGPIVPGDRAPEPPPLADIRPGLPPALVATLEGAVQLDRDRRIADVVTFMERLTTVAPPPPEAVDEEFVEQAAEAPTEWVALPVPRLPQRPVPSATEREIPRESAVEPSESASEADVAATPISAADQRAAAAAVDVVDVVDAVEARVDSERAPRTEPAEREVDRPVARETPRTDDRPEAAVPSGQRRDVVAPPADAPQSAPISAGPLPPPPRMSKAERKRQLKGNVAPRTSPSASPTHERPASTAQGDPATDEPVVRPSSVAAAGLAAGAAAGLMAGGAPATPRQPEPPRRDVARPDTSPAVPPRRETPTADGPPRADAPRADAPWPVGPRPAGSRPAVPLADAAAGDAPVSARGRVDAPLADVARTDVPPPKRSAADDQDATRWSAPLSDVELPPPEPVPYADTRPEPLTGPISTGPVQGREHTTERLEPPMRGGLGTRRPPVVREPKSSGRKLRDKKHEKGGTAAPAPLQPLWDTPAEFPLPAMPDPRPMPADAGRAAPSRGGQRLTRRGIAIAAIVVVALAGAVTLALMERAPDTTADLMQPESPIGYGGDVSIEPRSADTSDVPGPSSARGGGGAARGGSAGGTAVPPAARNGGGAPSTRGTPRGTARPAPGTRAATPAPTPAPTPTPRPSGATPATRGSSSTPNAERSTAAAAAVPPRAAEDRPSGACGSPALADQRACLAAQVARSDASLNDIYGNIIVAMRQRANTAPGDPDPPEVQRLRAVQRSWLARRDAECRRRGRGREGPLWATPRARCLAEFSVDRSRELSATLARLQRD